MSQHHHSKWRSVPEEELDTEVSVRRDLEPDEELVWHHPASPLAHALRRIPAALVGGVVLVGLAVMVSKIAALGAPGSGSIGAVFLAMTPFVIVALAFLLAPLFAWLKARFTTYAVTDRRVLFLERFPWRRVRSFSPTEIKYVHVSPDPDLTPGDYPRGSVFFKRLVYGSQNRWGRHADERIGFLDVPRHLEVAGLIHDLRDRAEESS